MTVEAVVGSRSAVIRSRPRKLRTFAAGDTL
jgi:hypothetical protein